MLQGVPGSCCLFPVAVLESAVSPKNVDSFYWRMALESKMEASCAYCYWDSIFLFSFAAIIFIFKNCYASLPQLPALILSMQWKNKNYKKN